ncbi:MAG: hypothetical protein KIS30_07115 [Thermoplasmata archaeon]|nr:hypothetical protein [Candidatus Sysuiplasma acidicola]MBX8646508.1 hypothetical protein [Candidatus Sysuiplasma acidicola]MDH2905486.1 hypothetical protein [Methanomassiliicoccales archaeon]
MIENEFTPPDLSYEPGVIGPFLPADILIFSLACAIGFSAAQFNVGMRYAVMLPFAISGFVLITIKRLRPDAMRTFTDFLAYAVADRFRVRYLNTHGTGSKQRIASPSFILEEINFISAGQRERERFASAFLGVCCVPGCPINFISLPSGAYISNQPVEGEQPGESRSGANDWTGRKFVVTVTSVEQRSYVTLLSGKSKPMYVREKNSMIMATRTWR